jgi:hypothetical protein
MLWVGMGEKLRLYMVDMSPKFSAHPFRNMHGRDQHVQYILVFSYAD